MCCPGLSLSDSKWGELPYLPPGSMPVTTPVTQVGPHSIHCLMPDTPVRSEGTAVNKAD